MVAGLAALALGPHGIGAVRFGARKVAVVATLSAQLGTPTKREVNRGCTARYTEVEWGDLAVEFRSGLFSGFRYIAGGLQFDAPPSRRPVSPRLATANGATLGSTLGRVRAAYGGLERIGAILWRAPDGLIFVDDSKGDPSAPSDRIVEIKIGTCGDF